MSNHSLKLREVWLPTVFGSPEQQKALSRLQRRYLSRRIAMAKAGAVFLLAPAILMVSVVAARPAGTTYQEVPITASSPKPVKASVAQAGNTPPTPKLAAAVALPKSAIEANRASQAPAQPAALIGPEAPQSPWVDILDRYLAGSPMAGQGRTFYEAATANGLDPRLSVGIAKLESGLGRAIPGGYNAYGMTAGTAPGHGRIGNWQAFTSWEDAIISNNNFIRAHWGSGVGPYQMRGYATSSTWAPRVAAVMSSIPAPPAQ